MQLPHIMAMTLACSACASSNKPVSPEVSPAARRPARASAPGTSCDEVSCLLVDQESPCCLALPHESAQVDREQFDAVMAKLAGLADECGRQHHYAGYFVVAVEINADGSVASVGKPAALATNPDAGLLACIGDVVRTARFGASKDGATLSYSFELHARR